MWRGEAVLAVRARGGKPKLRTAALPEFHRDVLVLTLALPRIVSRGIECGEPYPYRRHRLCLGYHSPPPRAAERPLRRNRLPPRPERRRHAGTSPARPAARDPSRNTRRS